MTEPTHLIQTTCMIEALCTRPLGHGFRETSKFPDGPNNKTNEKTSSSLMTLENAQRYLSLPDKEKIKALGLSGGAFQNDTQLVSSGTALGTAETPEH